MAKHAVGCERRAMDEATAIVDDPPCTCGRLDERRARRHAELTCWPAHLGLSIARFVRRARVAELVAAVTAASNDAIGVAEDARDYDCGASSAEWGALMARGKDAGDRFRAALSELATLAEEGSR